MPTRCPDSDPRRPAERRAAVVGEGRWVVATLAVLLATAPAPAARATGPGPAAGPAPRLGAFAVAPAASKATRPLAPQRRVIEGALTRGRTLASALRAQGVTPQVINQVARELRGHVDFRRAQPGHAYRLVQDGADKLVEFHYRISLTETYFLKRDGSGFRVTRDEQELESRSTRIASVISSTLYQSVTALGGEGQLARDFADIFAWDVDFARAVQPGDSFQILYERLYRNGGGRDSYVRQGRILAARFEGHAGSHTAVYFEPMPGKGGYYRPNGSSVEGEFLMAPLSHARITSRFSAARHHPILKITRPHHGIDYAADVGTPVWSVASGTLIHRGWQRGSGNLVRVKHDNGYVSSYLHLSRFAKGLQVGSRVSQRQVIGYVGQTGLATGPHLCFRIQKNDKYVDPSRLRMPAGAPIPGEMVATFRATRDLLLAELEGRRQIARNR
jgi:murein DD-endopeptidase MepM/ murein hydrolase activator NlpD